MNDNVNTNSEEKKVEPVAQTTTETPSAPAPTETVQETAQPATPVPQEVKTEEVKPAVETPTQEQTPTPAPAPVEAPKEEVKQDAHATEQPKITEPVKEEKPKKEKKKGKGGTIFLLFLLFVMIVTLSVELVFLNNIKNMGKGVTDLEEIENAPKKEEILYDSKKVVGDIDPLVNETILNYLYTDNTGVTYEEYVNNLPNRTKQYLSGILKTTYIQHVKLVNSLSDRFGFDVTLTAEDLKTDDEKNTIYTYIDNNKSYEKNEDLKEYVFKPFEYKRDFLILEYDDYVGDKENFSIKIYGVATYDDGKETKISNNRFTFVDGLKFEELKAKLPDLYADQKENFDTITYYFTLKKDKIYVKDIKLNEEPAPVEEKTNEENPTEEVKEEEQPKEQEEKNIEETE